MTTLPRALTSSVMSSGQSRPLMSRTPVRGRPSGTGFDESRNAKRKDTHIYIGRVYDRWCAARDPEEAERGKNARYLGRTR